MNSNVPRSTKKKSFLVPSRYGKTTTHASQSKPNLNFMDNKFQREIPRASSPRHDNSKCKDSLNIHDSVASIINPELTLDDVHYSATVSGMPTQKSMSVPNLASFTNSTFHCTSGTQGKQQDAKIFNERLRSHLKTWAILDKVTHDACTKILEKEKNNQQESLAKLKFLESAATQHHQVHFWCEKWLASQKSIDSQIEVFEKLNELMYGGSVSTGLLQVLRRIHDSKLLPVSQRMAMKDVQFSSFEDLTSSASLAFAAGEKFSRSIEGELHGIKLLAAQLKKLSESLTTESVARDKRNIAKLKEVEELFIHLLSLKVHKNQCHILNIQC